MFGVSTLIYPVDLARDVPAWQAAGVGDAPMDSDSEEAAGGAAHESTGPILRAMAKLRRTHVPTPSAAAGDQTKTAYFTCNSGHFHFLIASEIKRIKLDPQFSHRSIDPHRLANSLHCSDCELAHPTDTCS